MIKQFALVQHLQWAPLSLKVTDTPPWQLWQQICASPTCIPEQAKHWFPTTQFPVIPEREEMLIKCNIPKFAFPPSFTYSHGRCVTPAYGSQWDWENPLKNNLTYPQFGDDECKLLNIFLSSVCALILSFFVILEISRRLEFNLNLYLTMVIRNFC